MKIRGLSVSLPFGLGSLQLDINEAEQRAAWSLYVDLMTRVAIQPFDPARGSLRGVLTSLYRVFQNTRETLREAGPDVAHGPTSFGPLALAVLTRGLAPFLTRWHLDLQAYEVDRPDDVGVLEYELAWGPRARMIDELCALSRARSAYSTPSTTAPTGGRPASRFLPDC